MACAPCVIDAALEVGCDISNGIAGSQSTPQRADEQADGRELLPKRVVYLLSELTPLLVGEPRDLAFQISDNVSAASRSEIRPSLTIRPGQALAAGLPLLNTQRPRHVRISQLAAFDEELCKSLIC